MAANDSTWSHFMTVWDCRLSSEQSVTPTYWQLSCRRLPLIWRNNNGEESFTSHTRLCLLLVRSALGRTGKSAYEYIPIIMPSLVLSKQENRPFDVFDFEYINIVDIPRFLLFFFFPLPSFLYSSSLTYTYTKPRLTCVSLNPL